MSIKLLSKNVINQISAGEVVEKPASIVKELVENSLDAGASEIIIEIEGGGIDYISVKDNGCGIKADEVKLAFTPHATSKLENIDDLNYLSTMGFRGEALATISAVSKIKMITKTKEEDTGVEVILEGGEEISVNEVACITGTKIEVKNVFYNTPARLKFLRKPKTEENDITNFIEKLILANSNVSFKYYVDNKLVYNTSCGSIIDNIYTIYGKEMANSMLKVEFNIDNYYVNGYISKPEFSKSNRTYQSLFVNGRFCSNALVNAAISNAYENFTMKGRFPAYVLYINLPQQEVDVNVHPNKLEVKFENTPKIFRVFNDAVFKALSDFNHIRVIEQDDNQESDLKDSCISDLPSMNNDIPIISKDEGVSYSDANKEQYEKLLDDYSNSCNDLSKNTGTYKFSLTNNILPQVDITEDDIKSTPEIVNPVLSNYVKVEQDNFKNILKLNYKLIGVVFNTYLILEYNENMYLIDQHAAHERQRYDEIMNQLINNSLKIQDLIIPYILKVSQAEANFLNANIEVLNSFGIGICEFGYNTYKVSSVPLLISEINLNEFFNEIFDNLNSFTKTPQQTIKSRFMQMACKSAVKGGDKLSDFEIQSLLKRLESETEILLCPHGRPIVVEITKKQIEKWFKRIV